MTAITKNCFMIVALLLALFGLALGLLGLIGILLQEPVLPEVSITATYGAQQFQLWLTAIAATPVP